MIKLSELSSLNKEDIEDKLKELRKELIKQNSQIATGTTPKSPGMVKQLKKTIAKILTIKNRHKVQKEIKQIKKQGGNEKV